MYWGQVAVALAGALGTASYLYTRGRSVLVAVLAAVVVYFLVRWVIAWGYRTRYWYRRGTKDHYSTSCPDCGQYIYRRRHDWILKCGRCGWTAGWPVLRWVTQSVPARQLRRTVVGPQLVVVIVASALLLSGVTATLSLGPATLQQGESPNESGGQGENPNTTVNATGMTEGATPMETGTPTDEPNLNAVGFNETRVERLVFRLVNERRQTQDMPNYTYNEDVAGAAREHTEDMAENDYFSHTSLDGVTQQERYAPYCSVGGGENAHQTWVNREVALDNGSEVVHTNERELAEGIIRGWMNSPPHREDGIFGEAWDSAGVGIAMTEEGKVYAVMGFCAN